VFGSQLYVLFDYWSKAPVQKTDFIQMCSGNIHPFLASSFSTNLVPNHGIKKNNAVVLAPHTTDGH